jgi:hypothetical protein
MLIEVLKCPDGIDLCNSLHDAAIEASRVGNAHILRAILPHMLHYKRYRRVRSFAIILEIGAASSHLSIVQLVPFDFTTIANERERLYRWLACCSSRNIGPQSY